MSNCGCCIGGRSFDFGCRLGRVLLGSSERMEERGYRKLDRDCVLGAWASFELLGLFAGLETVAHWS